MVRGLTDEQISHLPLVQQRAAVAYRMLMKGLLEDAGLILCKFYGQDTAMIALVSEETDDGKAKVMPLFVAVTDEMHITLPNGTPVSLGAENEPH